MANYCCIKPDYNTADRPEINSFSGSMGDLISIPAKTSKQLNLDNNIHYGSNLTVSLENKNISYRENETLSERYVKFQRIYLIVPMHHSLCAGNRNCFRIIKKEDSGDHESIVFSCCTQSERDSKIKELIEQIIDQSGQVVTQETSLKITVQEASNLGLKNRYYCDIKLNDILYARTSVKEMRDMLYWGEEFDLKGLPKIEMISVTIWKMPRPKERQNTPEVVCQVNISPDDLDLHCATEKWYSPSPISMPFGPQSAGIGTSLKFSAACDLNSSRPDTAVVSSSQAVVRDTAPLLRLSARYFPLCIICKGTAYSRLLDLFRTQAVSLMQQLEPYITAKYREQLVLPVVRIAVRQRWVEAFLAQLVCDESKECDINLILRGNSMGSKAIECFLKMECHTYLKAVLGDMIRDVLSCPDLEIDRERVLKQKQPITVSAMRKRQERLESIVSSVLSKIFANIHVLPSRVRAVFREVCSRLRQGGENGEANAEFVDNVVSACLFLRLVCPAIMTPYLFQLLPEYSEDRTVHRAFTLVAKCVQNVANFASIEEMKEDYMKEMVLYCRNFYGEMHNFLRLISGSANMNLAPDNSPCTDTMGYARTSSYYRDCLSYDAARLSYHLRYVLDRSNIKVTTSLIDDTKQILADLKRLENGTAEDMDTIDKIKANFKQQLMYNQRQMEMNTKSSGYSSTYGEQFQGNLSQDDLHFSQHNFDSLVRSQGGEDNSMADILELELQKLCLIKDLGGRMQFEEEDGRRAADSSWCEGEVGEEDDDIRTQSYHSANLRQILGSKGSFEKYVDYADALICDCLAEQYLLKEENQRSNLEQIMKINSKVQLVLVKKINESSSHQTAVVSVTNCPTEAIECA